MKVAHLLRKYNPEEWGGTETVVKQLIAGLQEFGVESLVYCPKIDPIPTSDPLAEAGALIRRFHAILPVLGLSEENRKRLIAIGGNLLSPDLPFQLSKEKNLDLIHLHTQGRLGAEALWAARRKGIPCIASIHGGSLDIPPEELANLSAPLKGGWEWGKVFGWLLNSRKLMAHLDAIITYNPTEQRLIQEKLPHKRVLLHRHAIDPQPYLTDHRESFFQAFPNLKGKQILLILGRIDPQKNQLWLIQQLPEILKQHPNVILVSAGAITNDSYFQQIQYTINQLQLSTSVHFLGPLPQGDPKLIGLLQTANALLLPSVSEPFGLVILEAWAAKTPVLSSHCSGPERLIESNRTGMLFSMDELQTFYQSLNELLTNQSKREEIVEEAWNQLNAHYTPLKVAEELHTLYRELTTA